MTQIKQKAYWASLVLIGAARRLPTAQWYDSFAHIYDAAERRYHPFRLKARRQLRLKQGQTVLDVACGTGQNFEPVLDEIGPSGRVIGIDYSPGMLDKAAERRHDSDGNAHPIHLIQADIRNLSYEMLHAALPHGRMRVERILCTFGLTLVTDWEETFERMWDMLAPGGRCTLMDGYIPRTNHWLQSRMVNRLSQSLTRADVTRRFWLPLQDRCEDYEEERFQYRLGTQLVIASGTKAR